MQSFRMERLAVFLSDKFDIKQVFLQDETNLGRNAKVTGRDKDDLLKHRVFSQFMSVLNLGVQFLLLHHIEVHHVANVQIEDPVLRVLDSERVPYIELESLVSLDLGQLLHGRE